MVESRDKDVPVKFPREVLKDGWKHVCAGVGSIHLLKLRDAANIVGFVTYPVGWIGKEYTHSDYSPRREFEERWGKKRLLGIRDLPPTSSGAQAVKQGIHSRRNAAGLELLRLVKARATGLILYDERMRGRLASADFLCDGTLDIQVESSSVFAQGLGFDCMIDGPALLAALERKLPWREARQGKHEWFLIERHIRQWIESQGCPRTAQAISTWYLEGEMARSPP